jgi:uncharacterized lipoprotein YmbA
MNPGFCRIPLLALGLVGLTLAGFNVLKPSGFTPRSFVLTPVAQPEPPVTQTIHRTVGLGFVRLPGYLFGRNLAVRQGSTELVYLPQVVWAERLDHGLQRVLAANLTTLLPDSQMRLSAWRPDEVFAEIYVTVTQFDADTHGHCHLKASWRIVAPGGGPAQQAGLFQHHRAGPSPEVDPDGTIATMSALAADLSRTLADALAQLSLPNP